MKRYRLVFVLTLVFFLNISICGLSEKLEPIEDPKVYKKFDIIEGISKKEFQARLKEQKAILKDLKEEVDFGQYNMFASQHFKNEEYFRENYKSISQKIKAKAKSILEIIGITLFPIFMIAVFAGGGNMSNSDWATYMYLVEEEEEEMRRQEEINRSRRN